MTFGFSLSFLSSIVSGAIALFTISKAHRSPARWSFGVGMAILAVESLCLGFASDSFLPDKVVYWETLAFFAMCLLPAVWLFFGLTYGRGAYAEFLSRWRFCLIAALVLPLACCLAFRKDIVFAVPQPEGTWLFRLGLGGLVLNVLVVIGWVLTLVNLEATFRASVGTLRWRIKFVTLGLGILFASRAYTGTELLLFRTISVTRDEINAIALLLACLVMLRSLFRAGHFEVSVYPSHSILQNSITLLLAGAYLIFVGVLAKIVVALGGDASFELKAFFVLLVLISVAFVLLSDRVRLYAKQFASRHFQRPLYDYRTVWRLFTEGTTRRVEEADLCKAVVRLISDIFQTLSVTIWIFDEKREQLILGASTSLSHNEAGVLKLSPEEVSSVVDAVVRSHKPIDIDTSREPWAAPLRQSHPDEFAGGGDRFCVPMLVGGEPLGILVLADRVGGVPYSVQDFELLKCASDQAAAGLLNIQLSQRVSQSKQLEAFQAMSAFFVHDLKNTASTLSLMLQNLPVHYQDPVFREDALRGISKTVAHIDHLISRLSVLRHDLSLNPVECDINDIVVRTLKAYERVPGIDLEKDLQELPRIMLDPAQIQKVITNLLLNAQEAFQSSGQIYVETAQRNGWAVLTVRDNGCGMSPEFIQTSLFRPFKTTKKKGIGIGMFHCKMIVDAHHGRIEVESNQGTGTTFRVLLPIALRGIKRL